jgi:nucleoside-diphosphate-sugar epimerase
MKKKILVTGIRGQIGTKLLPKLIEKYGAEQIVATDITKDLGNPKLQKIVNYQQLDVTDREKLEYIVHNEKITYVCHLAAILSALAEREVELAKKVNLDSVHYLFRLAVKYNIR